MGHFDLVKDGAGKGNPGGWIGKKDQESRGYRNLRLRGESYGRGTTNLKEITKFAFE